MTNPNHSSASAAPLAEHADEERFVLIGRIASGLAHELNGPIGIALGFSELAKETIAKSGDDGLDPDGVKKLNEYLGLIESASLRARTLARQIWSFARAEPGTTSDFDLVEAVGAATALAAPAVKVGQVEIGRGANGLDGATARGDHALLTQSLVRLFLDSTVALPKGGSVSWSVEQNGPSRFAIQLAAEPWGEVPSAEWPVHESIKDAFRRQDGSITDPVERQVAGSEMSPAPSSPGWYLTASLPASAGD